jgi:hypothetical protein
VWIGDDIDDKRSSVLPGEVVEEADLYQRNVVDGSSIGLNCITSLVHTVVIMSSKIAAKHHEGSCALKLFLAPSKASWPPSTAGYDPERISAPW